MKRLLLVVLAVLTAVPAFAIEVYNNGTDTKVEINGSIRGFIGYGWGETPSSTATSYSTADGMMMGLQNNSRVGVQFQVGKFSGQFEIGAREKTMINETADRIGVRHAWGAYTTDGGHMFKFGKTSTLTSSVGYLSDIFDTDGSLNGYGGGIIMSRRFMMQYSAGGLLKGLSIQLIEDDTLTTNLMLYDGTTYTTNTLNKQEYIPRIVVSYDKKYDNLMYKLALSYTAVNGMNSTADTAGFNRWSTVNVFGLVFATKANFLDKRMHVSVYGRFGVNEDLYNEQYNRMYIGGANHTNISANTAGTYGFMGKNNLFIPVMTTASVTAGGDVNNIYRIAVTAEAGYKLTKKLGIVAGAGYQGTLSDSNMDFSGVGKIYNINSYAIFLQMPYTLNKYLMFTPQIAYYGNSATYDPITASKYDVYQSGFVAVAQLRVTF